MEYPAKITSVDPVKAKATLSEPEYSKEFEKFYGVSKSELTQTYLRKIEEWLRLTHNGWRYAVVAD